MNSETPTLVPEPLTKLHIAAMRKADRIVFRHIEGGICQIEALKEAPKASPTNPFPQEGRQEVACGSSLTHYGITDKWKINETRAYRAFVMIGGYDRAWQTIAKLLKPGDTLIFEWTGSNNSEYARQTGFHHDSLSLKVMRKGKEMLFNVYDGFCPDNSARMIKTV